MNIAFRTTEGAESSEGNYCLRGEEQLRLLFEQAPTAIGISRHGLTIYANPRYLKMFGFSSLEEISERPLIEQIAPQERERVGDFALRHDQGLPVDTEIETVGLRRDGTEFPFQFAVSRVNMLDGPAILGFFSDITDRKKTEEALRESRAFLQRIMDNASDGIFVKDNKGRMLMANPAYFHMMGGSPDKIIGKVVADYHHPEVAEAIDRDERRVIRYGISDTIEERILTSHGWRALHTTKAPYLDAEGRVIGYIGIARDITYRKEIEEELRRSEERFRTLSEATFEGIVVHDNGIIIDVNRAALEQTGYSRDEVLGRSILEFFDLGSMEAIEKVINLPVVEPYEARLMRKNGEIRTIRIQARTIDFHERPARVATFMDITDQVNARERIEELAAISENERTRLQTILNTLPVGVLIADARGRIIEVNGPAKEIMGGTLPLANSIEEYAIYKGRWADNGIKLGPKDWALVKAILKGEVSKGQVIDVERFDGTRGTILNSGAPLRNDKGAIVGGVAVFEDITKQRELEHEAIEAKERAELYIDLLTHDINNLNSGIVGYLQLVMDHGKLEKRDVNKVQKSLDLLESSTHLIENVKKIQKLEMGGSGHGPVDLGWLLEDAVQGFSGYPKKSVTIEYKPHAKRFVIGSDLLKDVFTNIIENAIKHSSGPVKIEVRLSKVFESGKEFYRVDIEDHGPGIPDEVKDKLFSRLQRGKTRAGGTGLGLYLVRRLVEDYHGRVWVEDRAAGDHAQGARFVVLLPVASSTI